MIRVSEPFLGSAERMLVEECLQHNQLTQGPQVARFERDFAQAVGSRHAVAVSSGTAALHLALVALGVQPGDEVLVPNLTFVATANAVRYCGATPILVEVSQLSWCMDPEDAERKITSRTKAMIPVHLYGVPCDMARLLEIGNRRGVTVIEDAAEGLGGVFAGLSLGTMGLAGTFSFYGNKVLTTGEGGAVVTDDGSLAERLRFLRGQAMDPTRRYYHPEIGFNYRMTDLQAAIGIGQVARMPEFLRARREIFAFYRYRLGTEFALPVLQDGTHQAPWLFTLLVRNRDQVAARMRAFGVETRPVFVPLNQLPPYRQPNARFGASRVIAEHGLSLPTHPGLSVDDLLRVCHSLREAI